MLIEKVLKGLDACADDSNCDVCPYHGADGGCSPTLLCDAKEIIVRLSTDLKPVNVGVKPDTLYRCGSCRQEISRKMDYCPYCGKKVQWDTCDQWKSEKEGASDGV